MFLSKVLNSPSLEFPYPIYVVEVLNRNSLLLAGGGGAVKTGVPNRIDTASINRNEDFNGVNSVHIQKAGGVDTGSEAVMSMTVMSKGDGAFIASLEGRKCVEYVARLKSSTNTCQNSISSSHVDGNIPIANGIIGREKFSKQNLNNESETNAKSEFTVRRRSRKSKADSKTSEHDSITETANQQETTNKVKPTTNNTEWELTKLREYTLLKQTSQSAEDSGSESPSGSSATNSSGMPTYVTHGGPGGSWLAVGSDMGSVFLINRYSDPNPSTDEVSCGDSLQPLFLYPDVSEGLSAGLCSMSLSSPPISATGPSAYPLLATICDRPDWSTLRIWRTDIHSHQSISSIDLNSTSITSHGINQIKSKRISKRNLSGDEKGIKLKSVTNLNNPEDLIDCSFKPNDRFLFTQLVEKYPYAMASCNLFSTGTTPPPSPSSTNSTCNRTTSDHSTDRSSYRFRHCQFMKYTLEPQKHLSHLSGQIDITEHLIPNSSLLVTTLQPLCANRRSVSRLVVWIVPHISSQINNENSNTNKFNYELIQLNVLSEITLPQGHMPACLAVHPSRSRGLIGVGTMDGRVDVYFISPIDHQLICVYSLNNAHPIFVTALTFLPHYEKHKKPRTKSSQIENSHSYTFDLVSVSVDRMLKLHHGPTYSQIGQFTHGFVNRKSFNPNQSKSQQLDFSRIKQNIWFSFKYFIFLFIILFLPIILAMFETSLQRFY